jgi:DNA-binding beta-propeller fold protein YncE
MLLKFTNKGKFLLQIGGPDKSGGNKDTASVNKPADAFVYEKTNEVFVADGYGNRRIVVFDADTGRFKRMWGAFGNAPVDAPPQPARAGGAPGAARAGGAGRGAAAPLETTGDGPQQFGGPVHAVEISHDGLVYVADRSNRRVQVFSIDGKYLTQAFVNRAGPSSSSAAGLALSPDKAQRFLFVVDFGNHHIVVLDRKSLVTLYQFGANGEKPGEFRNPHHMAVDSRGTIYTVEVVPGNRAQKFRYKGLSTERPPNAVTQSTVLY